MTWVGWLDDAGTPNLVDEHLKNLVRFRGSGNLIALALGCDDSELDMRRRESLYRRYTMRRFVLSTAAVLVLASAGVHAQPTQQRAAELKSGAAAPAFTIRNLEDEKSVTLVELKDKPVVLIFGSCT